MIDDGTEVFARLGGVKYVVPTGEASSEFRVVFGAPKADLADLALAAEFAAGMSSAIVYAKRGICDDGFCLNGKLRQGELGDTDNLRVVNYFRPEYDYAAIVEVRVVRKGTYYDGTRVTITLASGGPPLPEKVIQAANKKPSVMRQPTPQGKRELVFTVVNPELGEVTGLVRTFLEDQSIYLSDMRISDDDPESAGLPLRNQMPGSGQPAGADSD